MPEVRTVVLQDGEEIYTEAELQERIQQERKECALICDEQKDKYTYSDPYESLSEQEAVEMCAEAIRNKQWNNQH